MTQRVQFTRDMIVDAAFALTREVGWAAVTARTIAARLGSSTTPIYSSLRSMDDIEAEVREKAEALMLDFQQRSYTDNASLNMAEGYVRFAAEEPHLFRFLYVDRPLRQSQPAATRDSDGAWDRINSGATAVQLSEQVSTAMEDARVLKSWIFTHGLAAMISGGVLDLPVERIRSLLAEAGGAFFLFEEQLKELTEEGAPSSDGGKEEK